MNDDELMFIPLKVGFIRNNFIGNYPTNYEEYLTEYINNSKFVVDHANKEFRLNTVQSNKEPDIDNDEYQIDYKLLIDDKTMKKYMRHYQTSFQKI